MLKKGAILNWSEIGAVHAHLENLAQKHFAIPSLRPQQREVFEALAHGDHVLAMLPTGSGKTLIYALGSLLYRDSVTVVVCPLIALMRDQHQRMTSAGINTTIIYSEQPEQERKTAFRNVLSGQTQLLFVSPERFASPGFQRLLRRVRVGMVVIDEAHCVVSWGHSFRPEYSQIGYLLKVQRPNKILALTATASHSSRKIIREMLFPNPEQVKEVIDKPIRENIGVEVVRVFSEEERWLAVKTLLSQYESRKTILYFPRREQCQKAASELRKNGFNAVVYHAGLQRELRRSVEDYLRQSERPVTICATLAFGMGIDLPDVQLVIVVGFPGNIEELFQMMGRAGRKGEKAHAALVWSGSDPKKRAFQFEKMLPDQHRFRDMFQSLSHLFPGPHQSRLVHRLEIVKALRSQLGSEKELDQTLDTLSGILWMLAAGGGQQAARSAWVNFEVKSAHSVAALASELPAGVSRRRLVLEWLSQRITFEGSNKGPFLLAFPTAEIAEDLQMGWEKIGEVFAFYMNHKAMSFKLIEAEEVQKSMLFAGHFLDVTSKFPRYYRWRATLSQSLTALSSFVTAEGCRMSLADSFFTGPGVSGWSHAGVVRCGRCDLCERHSPRQVKAALNQNASALTAISLDHLQ